MDTQDKHQLWELDVEGFGVPILASELIAYMSRGLDSDEISQALLKSYIAKSALKGRAYARCGVCGCPLQYVAANATRSAFFRHDVNKAVNQEQTKMCSFYSGSASFFGPGEIYAGEGRWHFYHKHWLAAHLEHAGYQDIAVERFLFSKDPDQNARRRPDVYFCDKHGQPFAVELTRWWMSPETIAAREAFFRELGINLIWLFSPDCEANNNTTLNVIMYGSAVVRESEQHDYVLSKVECNAFILSPEAMEMTNQSGTLTFEVLYPLAEMIDGDITVSKNSDLRDITQLKLAPTERLPYAIPTSLSFQLALAEKTRNERIATARNLIRLRQLAHTDLVMTQQQDIEYYRDALRYSLKSLASYTNGSAIRRYTTLANDNIAHSAELFSRRLKRQEHAQRIRIFRRGINDVINMATTATNLRTVMTASERLVNIEKRACVYPSNILQLRLAGADKKVRRLLSHAQQNETEKQAKELRAKQYLIDEMNRFTEALSAGFESVVEDKEVLRLKGLRIATWAKRHGFLEQAERLPSLLESAIEAADFSYLEVNYPILRSGYNESARYKPELDRAFTLLAEKDLHSREKGHKKQQAIKQCTRGLVIQFRNAVTAQIEQTFERLISADPATLSSFVASNHKTVSRLVMLVEYLRINGNSFGQETSHQITTIDQSVKSILLGQDINVVYRQLKAHQVVE
ncbi:hypothetical protein ACRZ5S_17980 [Vibrio scophthalmi]|uniref:competence protein CoiA family protein n=1 Tax=Vibrio scophthalmi TaxID=45658 RepID=UPI003EB91168